MNDFKIVFVHGYTSSSKADWYPAIRKLLDAHHIDYVIPDLPGGTHPQANEWLEKLHNIIIKINKPLVLVGHSLGTRTVLLYLEKYQPKVKKVFLIAAFNNNTSNATRNDGETYPDFFEHKINLEKIKLLVDNFIVMHSRDDSSIPYEQGVEIASDLGAKLITFENKDHFCDPENATTIFKELQKELQFSHEMTA